MANTHTEDATGISAAIRTLATKKELGESEKRLNAASEALQRKMLEEIGSRDERMRKELKADLEQAIAKNRFFSPKFATCVEIGLSSLATGFAIFVIVLGIVEFVDLFVT